MACFAGQEVHLLPLELEQYMLWVYQCIFVPDVKLAIVHIVHYHIHPAEVVGGWVALLTIKPAYTFYLFGYA